MIHNCICLFVTTIIPLLLNWHSDRVLNGRNYNDNDKNLRNKNKNKNKNKNVNK